MYYVTSICTPNVLRYVHLYPQCITLRPSVPPMYYVTSAAVGVERIMGARVVFYSVWTSHHVDCVLLGFLNASPSLLQQRVT
jgi:hypothetical protein